MVVATNQSGSAAAFRHGHLERHPRKMHKALFAAGGASTPSSIARIRRIRLRMPQAQAGHAQAHRRNPQRQFDRRALGGRFPARPAGLRRAGLCKPILAHRQGRKRPKRNLPDGTLELPTWLPSPIGSWRNPNDRPAFSLFLLAMAVLTIAAAPSSSPRRFSLPRHLGLSRRLFLAPRLPHLAGRNLLGIRAVLGWKHAG